MSGPCHGHLSLLTRFPESFLERLVATTSWFLASCTKAPSEQYWQSAIVEAKKETTSNRPVSPPPPRAQESTAQLGWTSPVDAHRTSAPEELAFLLAPFKSIKEYGASRVAWHEDQCGIEKLTDFLLTMSNTSSSLCT